MDKQGHNCECSNLDLLKTKEVADLLSISVGHFRDVIRYGDDFPAAVSLGGGHPRWYRHEVIAWVANQPRVKSRRPAPSTRPDGAEEPRAKLVPRKPKERSQRPAGVARLVPRAS